MALIDKVKALIEIAKESGNKNAVEVGLFLKQRIANPDSYVVFLGETCSGKSTLINSFLGERVLPVSIVPSTGTVTEVMLDNEAKENRYCVINRNATMEIVQREKFEELAVTPDENVKRLRVVIPSGEKELSGVHVFDTPGYGSMIKEHEDVLMDFLSESDGIIYTVGYRSGFQKQDFEFLSKVLGMFRGGIPIYLVVNRCPEGCDKNDPRIKEIYRATCALLREEVPLYVVPNAAGDALYSLDEVKKLFADVKETLTSEERKAELKEAFEIYVQEYFDMVKTPVEVKYEQSLRTEEEQLAFKNSILKTASEIRGGIHSIVIPGFEQLGKNLERWVDSCGSEAEKQICNEIDRESTFKGDETKAFMVNHLVPVALERASGEVQNNVYIALDEIERQTNELLNKSVANFEKDISLNLGGRMEQVATKMGKSLLGKGMNGALLSYFTKFGGAGKAGAGVANAASHLLKKVGNLFGKTFSRETHNALKHTLAKIGATSAKAVSAAVTVVVEIAFVAYDLATWKGKLKKEVGKSVTRWKAEMLELLVENVNELAKNNIKTLNTVADNWISMIDEDDASRADCEKLKAMLDKLNEIEKE